MKTVLVCPPSEEFLYRKMFGLTVPPLGLAYIASVLENEGQDVRIIDMTAQNMNWSQFNSEISKIKPDLVGIYCAVTRIKQAMQAAEVAKNAGATVMLGGPYATLECKSILENNHQVDFVVLGEGEKTSLELVKTLEGDGDLNQVSGVAFRKGRNIVVNPERELIENLDSIPFPAWHLLPVDKYRMFNEASIMTMATSRGCPYNCEFCAVPAIYNRRWRGRSPASVVDEMELIHEKYHPDATLFIDDFFTVDHKRVKGICDEIANRKLDVLWGSLSTGTDLSYDLMVKMQKAGCFILLFGVESGSQKILDKMGRERTLESIKRSFKYARKAGIITFANVVLGLPGETRQSIRETMELIKDVEADQAIFFRAVPYSDFSLEELNQIERDAYKEFYGRKSYFVKHLARGIWYQSFKRHFSYDLLVTYAKWILNLPSDVRRL
ncbi:MAG TPA: radical SAM protein [archaeon]|nr:radical SAM protein [archaeon]